MTNCARVNDPQHWRDRAEEARIRAEQICNPDASRMMLEIAASYERLAEKTEERLRGDAALKAVPAQPDAAEQH